MSHEVLAEAASEGYSWYIKGAEKLCLRMPPIRMVHFGTPLLPQSYNIGVLPYV